MNITERVLEYPPYAIIEFRGDELADFIESIGEHNMTPWGQSLREYLREQKPVAIRGVPNPPPYLDEINSEGFGEVYGRDWYFEV